jgi:hypothetical protein
VNEGSRADGSDVGDGREQVADKSLVLDEFGEKLDRNGARGVHVSGLGPLNPVAAYLIQQVAHFIVARRRIRLTTGPPLDALWETVGRCGGPPQDQARAIALIAITLTFIPWILVPILLLLGWLIG